MPHPPPLPPQSTNPDPTHHTSKHQQRWCLGVCCPGALVCGLIQHPQRHQHSTHYHMAPAQHTLRPQHSTHCDNGTSKQHTSGKSTANTKAPVQHKPRRCWCLLCAVLMVPWCVLCWCLGVRCVGALVCAVLVPWCVLCLCVYYADAFVCVCVCVCVCVLCWCLFVRCAGALVSDLLVTLCVPCWCLGVCCAGGLVCVVLVHLCLMCLWL